MVVRGMLVRSVAVLVVAALVVACGKKGESGAAAAAQPPPEAPYTGAPVAFEAVEVSKDALRVRAYNFADKAVAQYMIVMRYLDAGGQPLKVKAGTPFEADFDFTSFSGRKFKVEPKSWGAFTIDPRRRRQGGGARHAGHGARCRRDELRGRAAVRHQSDGVAGEAVAPARSVDGTRGEQASPRRLAHPRLVDGALAQPPVQHVVVEV
jgi:hypothetical protein